MPIYLTQTGLGTFPLPEFAMLYFSVFLGYLITPIHPCVAYSAEFFKVKYKKTLKHFLKPSSISFGFAFLIFGIIQLI
jgi:hypothetical protein